DRQHSIWSDGTSGHRAAILRSETRPGAALAAGAAADELRRVLNAGREPRRRFRRMPEPNRGDRCSRGCRLVRILDRNVWCGRALQESFVDLSACGLASMYPASDWSVLCAPGHHGNQRACVLIKLQTSNGSLRSPGFACAVKTDPPSRPILSQTSAGIGIACYVIAVPSRYRSFVRANGPFLRPGLR